MMLDVGRRGVIEVCARSSAIADQAEAEQDQRARKRNARRTPTGLG